MSPPPRRAIADLALLGDGNTAAIVDREGAVCWLCWPRFDSPAIFASLLGEAENGEWRIAPSARFRTTRRYKPETAILETRFEVDGGAATLTDFMPFQNPVPALVRRLRGAGGEVAMSMRLAPRGGYGRVAPRFSRKSDGLEIACDGLALTLRANRTELLQGETAVSFTLRAGESIDFVLTEANPAPEDPSAFAARSEQFCEKFWREWSSRCAYDGPARELVLRSLIALKALVYAPSGGMAAAATSSLPELLGGARNWDYRFCWLRDSTFAMLAFLDAGYHEEARAWTRWLHAVATQTSPRLEVFAGVQPGELVNETKAEWLRGFADSRPVRIGNAARTQLQLGVYGEVQDALHQWRLESGEPARELWRLQRAMLESLAAVVDEPDSGIWEQRSKRELFTQSRAMAWAAFDRCLRSARKFDLPADPTWAHRADALHAEICARGYDESLGAFTRAYGSHSLDASCLLLPLAGFLPPDDPRIVGTVEAIRRRLGDGPFLHRYDTERENDGVDGGEGAFLPCSFWLADALVLQGRRDEAAEIFEGASAVANDLGLISEEYDVSSKQLLGNFPQALTHLGLVHTALNLRGDGPAQRRSARND